MNPRWWWNFVPRSRIPSLLASLQIHCEGLLRCAIYANCLPHRLRATASEATAPEALRFVPRISC